MECPNCNVRMEILDEFRTLVPGPGMYGMLHGEPVLRIDPGQHKIRRYMCILCGAVKSEVLE